MADALPVTAREDYQAWQAYGATEYRWAFNKLEVALRGGLTAGPAAVPPPRAGRYVSRPVYNLFGMGIGAEQFYYGEDEYEEFVYYKTVPPGYFWCEWLDGPHRSVDYQKYTDGSWRVSSVWEGVHYSDDNLTKFRSWTRLSNRAAPPPHKLPLALGWLHRDSGVDFFNVELRGAHVVEVHLRPGDLVFQDLPVGTTLVPVWPGMELPPGEFIPDIDPGMKRSAVSGHLRDVRDGFVVLRDGSHR